MKTNKFLAFILATAMLFTVASCGEKKDDETLATGSDQQVEEPIESPDVEAGVQDEEPTPEAVKPSAKPTETKPTQTPEQKPSAPQAAPSEAPTKTPESTPTATPTPTPEQKPKTVGKTLLDVFSSKATSASTAEVAEAILATPIIQFPGATMPVEPGLLSGFGNTEITGFSEGTMFGPMIGSIPFIGYIFNLEEGTNKADFISTLKSNANLRWNICVEADEMVVGSSGNKVFFVMCPKEFEE